MNQLIRASVNPSRRTVNGRLRGKQRLERRVIIQPTESRIEKEQELGILVVGFWMRLWAFLLDSLIIIALNGILIYPLFRYFGASDVRIGPLFLETLLTAALFFLYFAIMTKYYGQTIGKMVFGIRVISKDGSLLSWKQVFFREGVGRILHQVFFPLYVIYVTVAFTDKKQGIHDMIADSYVILER
jgi:uncharacterized RDD family membrane protein YckC